MTPAKKEVPRAPPKSEKWIVEAQKTKAKVSRSYQQNGEQRFEEEVVQGRPNDVRRMLSPKYAGEQTELEYVHTWTTLSREVHDNTPNGVSKRREQREVQTYDFGDGNRVSTSANPSGYINQDEADGKPMDKVDYLKNMHDQLDDRVIAQEQTHTSSHSTMWVCIVGVTIIAVAALVIAALV